MCMLYVFLYVYDGVNNLIWEERKLGNHPGMFDLALKLSNLGSTNLNCVIVQSFLFFMKKLYNLSNSKVNIAKEHKKFN